MDETINNVLIDMEQAFKYACSRLTESISTSVQCRPGSRFESTMLQGQAIYVFTYPVYIPECWKEDEDVGLIVSAHFQLRGRNAAGSEMGDIDSIQVYADIDAYGNSELLEFELPDISVDKDFVDHMKAADNERFDFLFNRGLDLKAFFSRADRGMISHINGPLLSAVPSSSFPISATIADDLRRATTEICGYVSSQTQLIVDTLNQLCQQYSRRSVA